MIFRASGVSQGSRSFSPDRLSRACKQSSRGCPSPLLCTDHSAFPIPKKKAPKPRSRQPGTCCSSLQVLARAEHAASAAFSSTGNSGGFPGGEGGEEQRTEPGHLKQKSTALCTKCLLFRRVLVTQMLCFLYFFFSHFFWHYAVILFSFFVLTSPFSARNHPCFMLNFSSARGNSRSQCSSNQATKSFRG